jgi:hypothetical protein
MKSSWQSLEVPRVRRLLFAVIFTSHSTPIRSRFGRALTLTGAVSVLAASTACDDPFAPRASAAVRTDSFTVFSVTETPVNAPAAFNIVFFTTLRLEPTYGFDLVFDIDESGNAVIIPAPLVGGAVTFGRVVGLQKITGDYDALTRAPATGYQYESPVTLAVGEGALVELHADQCQFQTSRIVYAKLQIQAVDPVLRRIAFRITYDPNCGFRSFLPGVPTN